MMILMEKVMRNNLFFISRSGWPYIAYALFASLIFAVLDLDFFSFISFIFALFFVYSFRNPERELSLIKKKKNVSPIDGVVREINELKDDGGVFKVFYDMDDNLRVLYKLKDDGQFGLY